jgi:hypothetical protein
MLLEHYEELCQFKDIAGVIGKGYVSPDWSAYEWLELQKKLIIVMAYDGEKAIGYSANILQSNLHYPRIKFVQNDVLFVTHEYRKGRIGLRLIAETKVLAKASGAMLMLWHSKPGSTLETLLPRLGCAILDTIWSERL